MCRFTAFYNSLPQSLYLSTTKWQTNRLIINKLKHKQNYLNNNQKTPSLFEEAMLGRVYDEPKDDGYNSINEKYRNYKGVYNQLNKKEKSLSRMHPFLAIKILVMR